MGVKAPHLLDRFASPRAYIQDLAARAERIAATGAFGPIAHEMQEDVGRVEPRPDKPRPLHAARSAAMTAVTGA